MYFLKLVVYVLAYQFHVSSIILTGFRQGGVILPSIATRTPKKPTQIRVKILTFPLFGFLHLKIRNFTKKSVFRKMNLFAKITFLKKLHLRCLDGFWMCFWLAHHAELAKNVILKLQYKIESCLMNEKYMCLRKT